MPIPASSLTSTSADEKGKNEEEKEPLLRSDPRQFVMSHIEYADIWAMYKKAVASFWTVAEVDLSGDVDDWKKLPPPEKFFLSRVLAFFAAADGIVSANLVECFAKEVQVLEARYFYGFQNAVENIHAEMYSTLIETYIRDEGERNQLFHAITEFGSIRRKAEWTLGWISTSEEAPFGERLVAFAAVEGVFFSASFAAIFWIKQRGVLPGLTLSNDLISRDEGLHRDFACLLCNNYLKERPTQERIHQIVGEAVELEKEFVAEALPHDMLGMNAHVMGTYVEYVADHLLVELNCGKLYNSPNPFNFMENISLQVKTNFLERRVGEYQKMGVVGGEEGYDEFTLDADF